MKYLFHNNWIRFSAGITKNNVTFLWNLYVRTNTWFAGARHWKKHTCWGDHRFIRLRQSHGLTNACFFALLMPKVYIDLLRERRERERRKFWKSFPLGFSSPPRRKFHVEKLPPLGQILRGGIPHPSFQNPVLGGEFPTLKPTSTPIKGGNSS